MNVQGIKINIPQKAVDGAKKVAKTVATKVKTAADTFVSKNGKVQPKTIKSKFFKLVLAVLAAITGFFASIKNGDTKEKAKTDETIKVAEGAIKDQHDKVENPKTNEKASEVQQEEQQIADDKQNKKNLENISDEELKPEESEEPEEAVIVDDEKQEIAEEPEETVIMDDEKQETTEESSEELKQESLNTNADDRYEDISESLKAKAKELEAEKSDNGEVHSDESDKIDDDSSAFNNRAQFAYMNSRETLNQVKRAHEFAKDTAFKDVYFADGTLMRTFDHGNMLEYTPDGILERRTQIKHDGYSIMAFDIKGKKTDIIDYSSETGKITVQKDVQYAHGKGTPKAVYHYDKNGRLIK